LVAVSDAEGAPTLKQQEEERERSLRNEVAAHPLVRAALETFPGATIAAVRERFSATEAGLDSADEAGTGEDEA
jgi:DNA polymerase-3 subunit gamma/tau